MDSADGVDLPDLLLYDSSWWALIKIYEGKVEKSLPTRDGKETDWGGGTGRADSERELIM